MGVFLLRKKRKLEGKSSPTNIRFDFHPFWKCPRKRNIQNGKISFIASQACNPSAHKNSNSLHMLALHKNHPSITLSTGFRHRLSEGVHPNKILVFLKNSPPHFREKFYHLTPYLAWSPPKSSSIENVKPWMTSAPARRNSRCSWRTTKYNYRGWEKGLLRKMKRTKIENKYFMQD